MSRVQRFRHTDTLVIVSIALLGAYGQSAVGILPVMISSWVEGNGFSEGTAGLIGSATLAGMTLGLMVSVILLRFRAHTWIAVTGIAIALVADVASIFQSTALSLVIVRLLAGLGYGLIIACVVSWFARHEMAARCFGTLMLVQILVFALFLTAIPWLEAWLGGAASYLCLISLGIGSLFVVPFLGLNQPAEDENGAIPDKPATFFPVDVPPGISLAATIAPAIVLVAAVGFWAFLQRFGVSVGIAEKQLGTILGLITLSGLPASVAVIWLGNRLGRLVPVLIGLIGLITPLVMFLFGASSPGAYVIGGVLFTMAWSFVIPTMQAIQADLDDTGQLAAISTTPQAIGSAIGPAAFALTLGAGGYTLSFIVMIVLVLTGLLVVIPPTLLSRRFVSG